MKPIRYLLRLRGCSSDEPDGVDFMFLLFAALLGAGVAVLFRWLFSRGG